MNCSPRNTAQLVLLKRFKMQSTLALTLALCIVVTLPAGNAWSVSLFSGFNASGTKELIWGIDTLSDPCRKLRILPANVLYVRNNDCGPRIGGYRDFNCEEMVLNLRCQKGFNFNRGMQKKSNQPKSLKFIGTT